MASMARGCTFGLLLLTCSQSRRFGDEHVDRVVFGEAGNSISFVAPELPPGAAWHGRSSRWPERIPFSRVEFLGEVGARIGFLLKNFQRSDQGRWYSITTNTVVTHYIAALVSRVEVDVGTTLHITPLLSVEGEINSITWKYTSTSTTKSTDFVEVHKAFNGRVYVNATTGKLAVREWTSFDDGFFTAEINGKEYAENFKVASIVRVKPGGELHLDPHFVGGINQFSWYLNNTLAVEYLVNAGGMVTYVLPHCLADSGNCIFDIKTGKLKIKSWRHALDGVFTMMINGDTYKNKIKVMGDVIFAPFREIVQLDPPPFTGNLTSIRWLLGGHLVVEFAGGNVVIYQTCENMGCTLNTTTGRLTITAWYPYDTDRYVMDVNDRRQPYEYLVAGVAKLDEYDVKLVTQHISDTKTMLICDGDFDGAEPVQYFWRVRGTKSNWVEGIYKMETSHIFAGKGRVDYLYDACMVKNPVSERVITLN